jgi:hypothetical protein
VTRFLKLSCWFVVLLAPARQASPQPVLVGGKPIGDLPRAESPRTSLELDKEFDGGSGIVLKDLTRIQIANLALLGKVWGFLKYHHPLIAAGSRHWDYELFRVLPRVLSAPTAAAARSAVHQWVTALGAVQPLRQPHRKRASTTAGAGGNVSRIPLPGGLASMISGIGVFYPAKQPTQRVGIIADIEVRPTIQGVRSGRDEVLEAALRQILGPGTPAATIERMAKH